MPMFNRITFNPDILGGKPCIKGTRISIEFILELAASGANRDDIVKAYPQLTADDVEEAMRFAASSLKNDVLISAEVSHFPRSHALRGNASSDALRHVLKD